MTSETLLPPSPSPAPSTLLRPAPRADVPFRIAGGPETQERQRLLGSRLARVVLADVLVAFGAPDSLALRAAAIGLVLPTGPGRRVVGFGSAAWFYAGVAAVGEAPVRLDVVIEPGRRRSGSPELRIRQVPLPPRSCTTVLGVPVTAPVRTAADVARDLPPAVALIALRRLGELTEVRPHQVLAELATMRYARGAATGRRIVQAWAQER